jgi:hypothetical protein
MQFWYSVTYLKMVRLLRSSYIFESQVTIIGVSHNIQKKVKYNI